MGKASQWASFMNFKGPKSKLVQNELYKFKDDPAESLQSLFSDIF